jgi:hypothetical protein
MNKMKKTYFGCNRAFRLKIEIKFLVLTPEPEQLSGIAGA